jgi:hypothetical protein
VRTCVAVSAAALLAAGCSRAASPAGSQPPSSGTTASSSAPGTQAGASFGTLANICHPGSASGAPDQGVTAGEIRVGVFTDASFTKDNTFPVTARVFTSWCNANGGIDGRKIVADTLDDGLFNVQQKMVQACGQEFVLAGGGEALDAAGVRQRLSCLLPSFPGEVVAPQVVGSSLQVYPGWNGGPYLPLGYYSWLTTQAYPDSAPHVGIITGDIASTQQIAAELDEGLTGLGDKVSYNDLYPPLGVADWTPYAEAIKAKGVKGLIFNGQWQLLTKLELALNNIGYKLDWIDANADAYTPQFIQLAGASLTAQNNYATLAGYYPLESAASNPAMQQLINLFKQYAPGTALTMPAIQSFSEWLLFAQSAESCGSNLTRACVYNAAVANTAWTGGGLLAASNLAPDAAPTGACFDAEKATPQGWEPAAFDPNDGAYRCHGPFFKLKTSYIPPTTLSDVGKSLADLK